MRERTLERYLVRETDRRGGKALKLIPATLVGFPDRTILAPVGRVAFVELKTPRGRLSPAQIRWTDILSGLGFDVLVVRTRLDVDRFLKDFFDG